MALLVIFQLLILWFDSGLAPVIFLSHYFGCILLRILLFLLVIIARYRLFQSCRDSRMLLFGFFSGLLLLTFISYHPVKLGKVWLFWFFYLFDIGVFAILTGIIFEMTTVIIWEITKNPTPFGFNLSLFSQRMRARRIVISTLSKFMFFYSCLICLGFALINMYYLFNWKLYLILTTGVLLGCLLWLVSKFQRKLWNNVNPHVAKIDLKLEQHLQKNGKEFQSEEIRILQTCRQILFTSTSIVWSWEDLFNIFVGLFLILTLPYIFRFI